MKLFLSLCALLLAVPTYAQAPALAADRLGWDQPAATLADASSLHYTVQIDGATSAALAATCTGSTSPYLCSAPLPAMTPGTHALTLVAATVLGERVLESPRSAPFSVTLVIAPSAPVNLRIVAP